MDEYIKVRGARQHNLKNISVDIPKNKLVVVTGVSGSGKSSLVFDTIYAEGQRRYVESLSAYARQFLGVMDKPDVDSIEGLSPAIAIDQKGVTRNPRSTVGTITEIYDFLRLLFARVGHPHCPVCGREISKQTAQQIAEATLTIPQAVTEKKRGLRILVLAPVIRDKKGEFTQLFENLKRQGYTKVRVDGVIKDLNEDFGLIRTNKHSIDTVIDRLVISQGHPFRRGERGGLKGGKDETKSRLIQSIEAASRLAGGNIIVSEVLDKSFEFPQYPKSYKDHLFSENFACPEDLISLPEIEPRTFSFNSPHGACPKCTGIGFELKVDPQLVLNPNLTVNEGGILPWSRLMDRESWFSRLLGGVSKKVGFSLDVLIKDLPERAVKVLLYGSGGESFLVSGKNRFGQQRSFEDDFEGVIPNLERRYKETDSDFIRGDIEKYMVKRACPDCLGSRLKKEALSVTILRNNISEISNFSISDLYYWIDGLLAPESQKDHFHKNNLRLSQKELEIGKTILKEIKTRLKFLIDVGLEYLSISRQSSTLAGGESQRIRLASQIGSGLSGVIYCLDEPSIGLHPRDQEKLIVTLKRLRDLGNSVIVVEHDAMTMKEADYLIDVGPGAGDHGGKLVSIGSPKEVMDDPKSITGQYLSGKKKINLYPTSVILNETKDLFIRDSSGRAPQNDEEKAIILHGCSEHNLKNITVEFPLKKLVGVTGVSGSGKSTLLIDTLYRSLRRNLGLKEQEKIGKYEFDEGFEYIDKIIDIDQSPIGRTPRSNPVTYIKTFDEIRKIFSRTEVARLKGFEPGRFSFNVRGGRCEACEGDGEIRIEMQFLPDVYVKCDVCQGKRYNDETLEVTYNGKNIHEILDMTIDESLKFFAFIPSIVKGLQTLWEVGLGYIKLGQPATTLSGGEAQRIKLAAELTKRPTGKTLYILDEPTTGLHFADLERLLKILKLLVEKGNSVIIIEHNLDVIKNCDWVIDLGPEGGDRGGQIIATGPVASLVKTPQSRTGAELLRYPIK